MATYYVNSGAGGANTGESWTNAFLTFAQGVTAATSAGDIIKVHVGHAEALAADTNYAFAASVQIICVDKDNSDALAVMNASTQYIGHTSTARAITLSGAFDLYFYGVAFLVAGTTKVLSIADSDGAAYYFENCYLKNGANWSFGGTDKQAFVKISGGTCSFGNSSSGRFRLRADLVLENVTVLRGGTTNPTCLVRVEEVDPGGMTFRAEGCDLSDLADTPLVGNNTSGALRAWFINCRLSASFVALDTQTNLNRSSGEVWLYNCASGDTHYHIGHYNALGSTTVDTGIYANDNICDADISRKIVGTANATFYEPYESPWIDVYHTGTSAITPSLECVRSGSATAYNNDTLWSEWTYQGTSGYPISTLVTSDRMTPLGSAAAQTTGALGAGDWTGANATSWFGKLAPAAAFTPVEVGHIRARVCIAGANTVYVDPQIRGLA